MMTFFKYKKSIKHAVAAVIVLASCLALPVLAADPLSILGGAVAGTGLDKNPGLAAFIGIIIKAILGFVGLLLAVLIVYAGVLWTTAQGDPKKVDKAKELLKQAVIGIVIIFAAYAITQFVTSSLAQTAYTK